MKLQELIDLFGNLFENWGLLIVFVSSFLEMSPIGWLIPGGALVAMAGFFAYPDTTKLILVILFATAGGFISLVFAYYLGKKSGNKVIKKYKKEKIAKRSEMVLNKRGPIVLLTSMLGGLTRFWVAYIAGTHKYKLSTFLFYALLANFLWMSLLATLGFLAGTQKDKLDTLISQLGIVSWIFVIIAIAIVYWTNKKQYEEEIEE